MLPRNGIDGWSLVEYDWNEKTGVAHLEYERVLEDGTVEQRGISVHQPAGPMRPGWKKN